MRVENLRRGVAGAYAKLSDADLHAELERVVAKSDAPDATVFTRMLRELHAHQIELEIQHRELLKAQQQLEESRNRGAFSDISDQEEMKKRLHKLAYYDELTGLPNRTLLYDRLSQELVHSKRDASMLAILFVDLDGFKAINDLHGHYAGDQFLGEVSQRLASCVREGDTLSRMGGDEFVALLRNIADEQVAAQVAGRMLETCAEPFVIEGHELFVTVSVGISIHPRDGDNGRDLLRNADDAMYHAKACGKNNYQFFSESAISRQDASGSMHR